MHACPWGFNRNAPKSLWGTGKGHRKAMMHPNALHPQARRHAVLCWCVLCSLVPSLWPWTASFTAGSRSVSAACGMRRKIPVFELRRQLVEHLLHASDRNMASRCTFRSLRIFTASRQKWICWIEIYWLDMSVLILELEVHLSYMEFIRVFQILMLRFNKTMRDINLVCNEC